jgi:hypothetical protein
MILTSARCSVRRWESQTLSSLICWPVLAWKACFALLDQRSELCELLRVLGEVGAVGDELVAGQAGVAALARLAGRQHAEPIGKHAVGALVELERVVEVARVDLQFAGVGGDLAVAQELALVGLAHGLGVVHRHPRRRLSNVGLTSRLMLAPCGRS